MSNQFVIVRLDDDRIHLTKTKLLSYVQTNLPKDAFKFDTRIPIFWKLQEKYYDPITGTLTVEVIDYKLPANSLLPDSEPGYDLKRMNFEKLDWVKFEPLIYTYIVARLKDIIFNYEDKTLYLKDRKNREVNSLKQIAPNLFFNKYEPVKEEREIEYKIKYEDAKFEFSKISFSVHLKPYKEVRQLTIDNPYLRPEFEYVKQYFVKKLGKSFLAKIKLILLNNKIEEISAASDDIGAIDEKLINSIKIASTLNLRNLVTKSRDKILYNISQLSAEAKELSLLTADAREIVEIFIKDRDVKNGKQLEYLAKDKQSLNSRLQFTVKPLFGFLFHEIGNKECFIWELLNSHATYIWKNASTDARFDLSAIVEEAISTIKSEGREAYKKYYRTLENPAYRFGAIDHSSSNLTEEERFDEWKGKLESVCS